MLSASGQSKKMRRKRQCETTLFLAGNDDGEGCHGQRGYFLRGSICSGHLRFKKETGRIGLMNTLYGLRY